MKLPAPASTAPATLGAGIAAVGAACIVAAVTSLDGTGLQISNMPALTSIAGFSAVGRSGI